MVGLLIGLPAAVGVSFYFFPKGFGWATGWVLPVVIFGTAALSSCRLVDAGYRWWIGAAILLILLMGPAMTILQNMSLFRMDRAYVPYIVIGVPLVIVLFAIWVGTRRPAVPTSARDRANLSDIFD